MEESGKTVKRGRSTKADYWSSIPGEILSLIVDKTGSTADYVRVGAVCRSWYSLSTYFRASGPLFMSGTHKLSDTIPLLNPASDETLLLDLPMTVGTRLWGSPFGWLITFDHSGSCPTRYNLLNPFTGAIIPLPSLSRYWTNTTDQNKAFLTASPDSDPDNFVVVIVSSLIHKLAFIKPGLCSKKWSYISLKRTSGRIPLVEGTSDFSGVTYFQGKLFGLRFLKNGALQMICFQPTPKGRRHFLDPVLSLDLHYSPRPTHHSCESWRYYLVDLDGQLCLCVRYYNNVDFKMFKIDLSSGDLTLLHSLGGYCVFLEDSYSFSYKISYPPTNLFEKLQHAPREFVSNYVFYFTDTYKVQVWDMVHSCRVHAKDVSMRRLNYQPFWILPPIK